MYVASFSKYISFRNQPRAGNPRSQFDSLKFFSMGKKKPSKGFLSESKGENPKTKVF